MTLWVRTPPPSLKKYRFFRFFSKLLMIKMNIKQIICEEIYKILDEYTILMEYAYKRKEYERDVSARMQQILENWYLIHYVS